MSPTVQAAQQVSCRAVPGSFLRAVATTRSHHVKLAPPASSRASNRGHYCKHVGFRSITSTSTSCRIINRVGGCSSAPFGNMLLLRRAVPVEQQQHSHIFSRPISSVSYSGAAAAVTRTRAGELYSKSCAAQEGYTRAFGGQSVVPWELALFLVEEASQVRWRLGLPWTFAQHARADWW